MVAPVDFLIDYLYLPYKLYIVCCVKCFIYVSDYFVKVQVSSGGDTFAILNITADAVAPFVWLETSVSGVFSDNGFTILAPQTEIRFDTRGEKLDMTVFQESLTIRDLASYNPRNVTIPPPPPDDGGDGGFFEVVMLG